MYQSHTFDLLGVWIILLALTILSIYSTIILVSLCAYLTLGIYCTIYYQYQGNARLFFSALKDDLNSDLKNDPNKYLMTYLQNIYDTLTENIEELKIFILDCAYMTKYSYFPWVDRIIPYIFQNNLKQKAKANQQAFIGPSQLLPYTINKLEPITNIYLRIKYFMTSLLSIEEALAVAQTYYAKMISEQLKQFESIHLDLNRSRCSTSDLALIIRSSKDITSLDLAHSSVKDEVIEVLAKKHPNIKQLDLSGTYISEKSLEILSDNCKQLVALDLRCMFRRIKYCDAFKNINQQIKTNLDRSSQRGLPDFVSR